MDATLLALPTRTDSRGSLMFAEAERHVPFVFRRLFMLYGISDGATRGGHAHRALHQCFIAFSGSFDVSLDDGTERQLFHLESPTQGLHVGPGVWADLRAFSAGATCGVLASDYYDETDYMRDYDAFLRFKSP
jgi:hypothetical protein